MSIPNDNTLKMKFDPIEIEYNQFIEFVSPDTKRGKLILESMDQIISKTHMLFGTFVTLSEEHKNNLFSYKPVSDENLYPKAKYAQLKMQKLQSRFYEYSESFYMRAAVNVSKITHFLAEAQLNSCPVYVYTDEIQNYVNKLYEQDETLNTLKKKIKELDDYANYIGHSPVYPDIPVQQILAVAKEVSGTVNPETLHSSPNILDDFIFYFIQTNNMNQQFEGLMKEVTVNEKLINMRPFSPFIVNFVQKSFGVEIPSNEVNVLRVAVARYFFEQFYLHIWKLYVEQPNIDFFLQNCIIMSNKKPYEMKIPERYVRDCDKDSTFVEIIQNNKTLQELLDNLLTASFYIYPADILQSVYAAMKNAEQYAKIALLERKYGENIDWSSEEAAEATSDMAFDDFFPLFTGFFSVSPPSNALALYNFFNMIERLVVPSTFDYAKIVFMTSIDHLLHFNDKTENNG